MEIKKLYLFFNLIKNYTAYVNRAVGGDAAVRVYRQHLVQEVDETRGIWGGWWGVCASVKLLLASGSLAEGALPTRNGNKATGERTEGEGDDI